MRRAIGGANRAPALSGPGASPPKLLREGRALPVLRAVPHVGSRASLREPTCSCFVTKHDNVFP